MNIKHIHIFKYVYSYYWSTSRSLNEPGAIIAEIVIKYWKKWYLAKIIYCGSTVKGGCVSFEIVKRVVRL